MHQWLVIECYIIIIIIIIIIVIITIIIIIIIIKTDHENNKIQTKYLILKMKKKPCMQHVHVSIVINGI